MSFENVTLTAKRGLECSWISGLRLTATDIRPAKGSVLRLANSKDVAINNAVCPASAETFLRVEGAGSRSINLGPVQLAPNQRAVEFADGASPDSVSRKEQ
ncbi:MAG: hypothetical protein FJ388_26805 [Verrucomicrobia bacterium]|nr:hypothetical protein [Verrucomicrobiota bacterium]